MRNLSGTPENGEDISEQDALRLAEDMRRQVKELRNKAREYRKVLTAAATDKPPEKPERDRR